jgi:glycosyltransferase involved in cell wall biosynthesis
MISIVIPTLQEEKVLAATLSGLKALRAVPHEIIVSDGGSRDQTVEIARRFADQVIEHRDARRQTIAEGRNAGARVAQGEFIVFLDADCTIENPDVFFSLALQHFTADPRLVALTAYLRVLPSEETFADRLIFGLMNFVTRIRNNMWQKGDAPGGEFQMVRRSAFASIGGYRGDLVTHEDRDLFARLAKIGRVLTDPKLTVFHTGRRAHNVGWSRLILLFFVNTISYHLRGKVVSKEWNPER